MKLLVVDDSQVTRKVIKAVAASLRLETEEAQDGVEAMEKLEDICEEIGLILLDWNMPRISGYDVLVNLKEDERYKHIPVMMVTALGQKESIVAAVKAGANNYLTKPFTTEELSEKIMECLEEAGEPIEP